MLNRCRLALMQCCIWGLGKSGLSDEKYNRLLYRIRFGRRLRLDPPQTFNEHIMALKLRRDDAGYARYTDKYEVRDYVRETVGEAYLVPELGVWETAESVEFDALPERFILKATHGSGWNLTVTDKNRMPLQKVRKKLRRWLRRNYFDRGREKNYRDIRPRIVCEQLLEPSDPRGLLEFKVFCFAGKPAFYTLKSTRSGRRAEWFYASGEPVAAGTPPSEERPDCAAEVLELAGRLARPFAFVRVDFYVCDGAVRFSELTFHPGGGLNPFDRPETDRELGKFFEK